MNDAALIAATRRLRTAHVAFEAAHTALHEASETYRLAEHELTEAAREHRILLVSTEEADLIEAPQ